MNDIFRDNREQWYAYGKGFRLEIKRNDNIFQSEEWVVSLEIFDSHPMFDMFGVERYPTLIKTLLMQSAKSDSNIRCFKMRCERTNTAYGYSYNISQSNDNPEQIFTNAEKIFRYLEENSAGLEVGGGRYQPFWGEK